jgi:hypothetical protein
MSNRASLVKTLSSATGAVSSGVSLTSEQFVTERFKSCRINLAFGSLVGSPSAKVYLETSPDGTNWYGESVTEKVLTVSTHEGATMVVTSEPCQKYTRVYIALSAGTSFSVTSAIAEAKT